MMYYNITLLVLFLFLLSCNNNNTPSQTFEVENLYGEWIGIDNVFTNMHWKFTPEEIKLIYSFDEHIDSSRNELYSLERDLVNLTSIPIGGREPAPFGSIKILSPTEGQLVLKKRLFRQILTQSIAQKIN